MGDSAQTQFAMGLVQNLAVPNLEVNPIEVYEGWILLNSGYFFFILPYVLILMKVEQTIEIVHHMGHSQLSPQNINLQVRRSNDRFRCSGLLLCPLRKWSRRISQPSCLPVKPRFQIVAGCRANKQRHGNLGTVMRVQCSFFLSVQLREVLSMQL